MRRHADLTEALEDVLRNTIIEYAFAFDQLVLLGIECRCIILEVLDESSRFWALIKHLGFAFVYATPPVHGSWSFDDHAHALFNATGFTSRRAAH